MPLTLLCQAYFQRDRRRHRRDAVTAVTVGQTNIRRYSRLQSGGTDIEENKLCSREKRKKRKWLSWNWSAVGKRFDSLYTPSLRFFLLYICVYERARVCVCVCVPTKLLLVVNTHTHTYTLYVRTHAARTHVSLQLHTNRARFSRYNTLLYT